MRHGVAGRKLGVTASHRFAMFRNMATSLLRHEIIKTTLPKAKELRPFIEKLVTSAKKGDLATRRVIISKLSNRSKEVKKLFEVLAPKYKDVKGGYTRVLKLGARKSDGAKMAIIEFV